MCCVFDESVFGQDEFSREVGIMSVDIAVKKYFGDFTLDIQFQSQDNRIAVLGESGSGKSMLLKCIARVMTAGLKAYHYK